MFLLARAMTKKRRKKVHTSRFRERARVARVFLIQDTKTGENIPKLPQNTPNVLQNIPNVHKIYQMVVK
jgi:tRNA/tmRNA/rRNA uracil-C5-methylase (TrmA/RlmC/RlmD family)